MFLGVLTHQALGLGLICGNRERLIMTFKQLAFILLVVSIIALCACGGVFAGRLWQYTIDDARIRGEVAERLEVSDDWAEIRDYVDCEILTLGSSRREIEERLLKVGPYKQHSFDNSTTFVFDNYFIRLELSDYTLWFNDDDTLREKVRRAGLDFTTITCP